MTQYRPEATEQIFTTLETLFAAMEEVMTAKTFREDKIAPMFYLAKLITQLEAEYASAIEENQNETQ